MNRILVVLASALLLAGCSGLKERSYGSWLDRIGRERPANLLPLAPEERVALQGEATQLRKEADGLRVQMSVEPSRVRRVELLAQIQVLGDRLREVETTLREGGRRALIVDRLPGAV